MCTLPMQLMSRRSAGGMNAMMAQQQMPMHGLPPMAMAGMGMHMGMGMGMGSMGMGMGMGNMSPMSGMTMRPVGGMGLSDFSSLPPTQHLGGLVDGDGSMGCNSQELLADAGPARQVNAIQLDPRAASYMARQPQTRQVRIFFHVFAAVCLCALLWNNLFV